MGGVAYLASLTEGLPLRPVIEEYIRIVKDKSLLRRLMLICSAAIARAADQSETALEVLGAAESQLLRSQRKGHHARSAAARPDRGQLVWHHRQSLQAEPRGHGAEQPGFHELDRMTSGLQKGELIIIAARPSMGKTALAINIAQNAAIRSKAMVAVFSLEMSKESLLRRMLASQAWVDQRKLQTGFLGARGPGQAADTRWSNWSSRTFSSTTRRGFRWPRCAPRHGGCKQTAGGLDLVVVDYLQLMSATLPSAGGKRYENRTQEVSAISRGLKALAKELDVPVVALSQLSPRQRAPRRRQAADAERSAGIGLH